VYLVPHQWADLQVGQFFWSSSQFGMSQRTFRPAFERAGLRIQCWIVTNLKVFRSNPYMVSVPDRRSWSLEVVVIRRINNSGTVNFEWGGSGEN
jgi:hypothetical protein